MWKRPEASLTLTSGLSIVFDLSQDYCACLKKLSRKRAEATQRCPLVYCLLFSVYCLLFAVYSDSSRLLMQSIMCPVTRAVSPESDPSHSPEQMPLLHYRPGGLSLRQPQAARQLPEAPDPVASFLR